MEKHWDQIADVVVVGNGGAGGVAAIGAHDLGAEVLVIERQQESTHCSSTKMSGGTLLLPRDERVAINHLRALFRVPAEVSWVDDDIINAYVKSCQNVKSWVEQHGGSLRELPYVGDHTEIPGYESLQRYRFNGMGFGIQRFIKTNETAEKIDIMYGTRAKRLVTDYHGRVIGLEAETDNGTVAKTIRIGASKGVVLACGGFEYNDVMKLTYLPVHPTYFTGHNSATGDGIKMAMGVGSDLWHMNCLSARLVLKMPDFPIAFSVDLDTTRLRGVPGIDETGPNKRTGYIIVDRLGNRFTNEDFKIHSVYYELTSFDTHRMVYPRVPCYWIFDRQRMEFDTLISLRGGAAGPSHLYEWNRDNSKGLEKGEIISGNSFRELARKLDMPPDNLENNANTYNRYCTEGKDPDFGRSRENLIPLDAPPYYAMRLWPGGPNTQGGPRRNARCQIMNVDGDPIPGLYGAGEMGSIFGMFYPGGGSNLAECFAMGQLAGANVTDEPKC